MIFHLELWKGGALEVGETVVSLADADGVTADDLERADGAVLSWPAGRLRFRASGAPAADDGLLWDASWGPLALQGRFNVANLRLVADESEAASLAVSFELARGSESL